MNPRISTSRRRFVRRAGVALAAPLALVGAAEAGDGVDALAARLAALEDADAIRALTAAYVRHLNAGDRAALARLFADPAQVPLHRPIRAVSIDPFAEEGSIEWSADRRTASARATCTARVETPIEPDCTLVQMARVQGDGVLRRTERGVLEYVYVKEHGAWGIGQVSYHPL